ncbi:Hermansky-Pudlak syndrome 1 protein -like protein [Takifugu flavidus]|uniref:Hermansky-Pudlak syndrome 1 protein-like protein n=1 Tax=Takifugu flavidus TaxID=433684 RepID=A0A5C6PKH8_9TELE|nr:Hermansky-Pudlak syndrome 1 protein -like protein [Takifugu flavidus]
MQGPQEPQGPYLKSFVPLSLQTGSGTDKGPCYGTSKCKIEDAVERLIHPTLCEQCIEFLERRLVQQLNGSVERAGEEVLHAFILVHTKLLAFYSSRNASTLSTSDLLALIIMAQNMYPSNMELEDPSPEEGESTSGSGHESFYTPEPSPTDPDSSGSADEARKGGTPVFEFVDPDIQMAEDSLQTLEVPPPDPSTPRRVFLEVSLKEGLYPMMPHSMYCLPLWPGITLVLITKIPTGALAMSVYKYLEAFAKLEKRLMEGQEGSAASRGQPNMHEVRNKLDKFIKLLGPREIQTVQLQNVWTEFKNRAFSRGGPGFNKDLIPWCKNMKTQLCGIYKQCFLTDFGPGDNSQHLSTSLQERAQAMVQEKLMDWKDFLLVKSRRNITMVSYLLPRDFPGLIHFICVDRSTGQMIAPSLSVTERTTSELGKGPVAQFIKNKVWKLVSTTRHYLQKGYSTVTLRDGDFFFCYFLWFENESGFKLEAGDIPVLPDDFAPIGMLAWDYYRRKLLRYYSKSHQGEVVKCYELLTVHLGVIPAEIILQHCRQLASRLWEPTRNPLL